MGRKKNARSQEGLRHSHASIHKPVLVPMQRTWIHLYHIPVFSHFRCTRWKKKKKTDDTNKENTIIKRRRGKAKNEEFSSPSSSAIRCLRFLFCSSFKPCAVIRHRTTCMHARMHNLAYPYRYQYRLPISILHCQRTPQTLSTVIWINGVAMAVLVGEPHNPFPTPLTPFGIPSAHISFHCLTYFFFRLFPWWSWHPGPVPSCISKTMYCMARKKWRKEQSKGEEGGGGELRKTRKPGVKIKSQIRVSGWDL